MIDASSDSPFWNFCWKLVARMALLDKGEVEETYFPNSNDYILLWKLEVLDTYQRRGYAKQLLNLKKIKPSYCRNNSKAFF